ncbi:MAG: hypothetical protein V2A72_04990 [Candidatus Omnitrophota bacterium]
MISQTGNKKLKSSNAFTLIELILTTIIVLVIVGLSAPLFKKTFSDLRVNLLAKDMASLMNLAREKAIMTRTAHLIKIDVNKKTYRMYIRAHAKDEIIPAESKWGRTFKIPQDIKIDASEEMVEFFPDGSSEGIAVSFTDTSGTKSALGVDAATGEIHVGENKKSQ